MARRGSRSFLIFFYLFSVVTNIVLSMLISMTNDVTSEEQVTPCDNCNKILTEQDISPEELRQLRVEYIKEQILQKLRMKAPPKVIKPVLPEVLLKGQLLYKDSEEEEDEDIKKKFSREDFYGTTQEIVIFPDNTSTHICYTRDERRPNCCFRFRLTRDVTTRSVSSAELWVYKVGSNNESNHTYTVVEVSPHPRDGEAFSKRVVAVEDTSSSPGWMKFDLSPAVRTWSLQHHLSHVLEISCTGCMTSTDAPVSVDEDQKPFLIVHTDSWKSKSRNRRSITCTENTTQCCKERFQVVFRDIGWQDWIIRPLSYDANFCRGSCLTDVSTSRYYHTTIIQRYIQKHSATYGNYTLGICCTPTSMKPLTLIYIDEHKNIFKTALPNMIVESCDCA